MWNCDTSLCVPTWQIEEAAETMSQIQAFMDDQMWNKVSEEEFKMYKLQKLVTTAFNILSIELETTEINRSGTFENVLEAVCQGAKEPHQMSETFNVEGAGNGTGEWRCMTWRCINAIQYLSSQSKLSADVVIKTHEELMRGAQGDTSSVHQGVAGGLRTASAAAGNYVFPHPSCLKERLENIVSRFESDIILGGKYAIGIAVDLMYDFVTLHPFCNGNGRMCRMLFGYALMRTGFPVACNLTYFKKPKKYYIEALTHAQGSLSSSSRSKLNWLAIYSIGAATKNMHDFFQPQQPDNKPR